MSITKKIRLVRGDQRLVKLNSLWSIVCNLTRTTNLAVIIGLTILAITAMLLFLFVGHEHQAHQVLLNLLSNSIKYNQQHGKVWLEVDASGDNTLRLTVSDTGHGIADEKIKELFQPFNRLDAEHSEIEGSGIGLAITRRLVEMMEGRIGVNSELGTGSHFWVEFPVESLPQQVTNDDSGNEFLAGNAEQNKPKSTVLYIEDNPGNLKLVSQILAKREQIKLITAHDARLGLELANSHRPELILLDINMPKMDGYQVLDILRQENRLKDVPVIAVTANAMPRDIERGKKAGFGDYLTKPLNIPLFLATIDQYLK